MDLSLTIESLMNTIHGLKLSFGVNETNDCSEENNTNSDNKSTDVINCEEFRFRNTAYSFPKHQQLLLEYCMFISAVCLVMNLIVYSFVPKLRNTPGKCLMSLSMSLLLVNVSEFISFHIEVSPVSIPCVASALLRLYSFLSSFTWMNVMAYDVHNTFARSNSGFKLSKNSNKRFYRYSCFAWLVPGLIVMVALIVQVNIPFDSPYNPAFGKTICCISHFTAMVIFFMCPLSITLTLNVTLFIVTAHELKQTMCQTRMASKRMCENQLFLNIRLVLVLGLTWIFGFLGMFVKISVISYISIVFHGLHGTFIFVVFTVKPKVFRLIRSRIKHLRDNCPESRRYSSGSNSSSSKLRTHSNSLDTNNSNNSKTSINFNYNPVRKGYRDRFSSF